MKNIKVTDLHPSLYTYIFVSNKCMIIYLGCGAYATPPNAKSSTSGAFEEKKWHTHRGERQMINFVFIYNQMISIIARIYNII